MTPRVYTPATIAAATDRRWLTTNHRISRDWMIHANCRGCDPELWFPHVPALRRARRQRGGQAGTEAPKGLGRTPGAYR